MRDEEEKKPTPTKTLKKIVYDAISGIFTSQKA